MFYEREKDMNSGEFSETADTEENMQKYPVSESGAVQNHEKSPDSGDRMKPVFPEAFPFFRKEGDKAVLIIHGYLGSPYDVKYLAERLSQNGYTVSVPLLPGHGTCKEDFLTKGKKDWLEEVYKSHRELEQNYKEVIIAGFSMGGLLAVNAASRFKTDKLILVAPALTNRKKLMLYSTPLLKYFKKTLNKNCRIKTYNEYEEYLKEEYWSKDWIKALSEVLFLQIKAKKLLKTLKSKILLLISESDNTVPPEVSEVVRKRADRRHLTEKRVFKSGHMIFHSEEKDDAVSIILDWLRSS